MNGPLVSILIVTYNQAEYVGETLDSAIAQDDGHVEIVVADDASRDGTAQIVSDYAQRYPGLIVPILGDVNRGVTENCNRGLAVCRGKYIAFLGGDDLVLPDKLKKQTEWLEADEGRALCYHDTEAFDSSSGRVLFKNSDRYRFHDGSAQVIVRYGCFFDAISVMIRRPPVPVGFDGRIKQASDWLYWVDVVASQNGRIGHIDGIYARHRMTGNNITADRPSMLQDKLLTLNIIADKYETYRRTVAGKISETYLSEAQRAFSRGSFTDGMAYVGRGLRTMHGNWAIPIQSITRRLLGLKY